MRLEEKRFMREKPTSRLARSTLGVMWGRQRANISTRLSRELLMWDTSSTSLVSPVVLDGMIVSRRA